MLLAINDDSSLCDSSSDSSTVSYYFYYYVTGLQSQISFVFEAGVQYFVVVVSRPKSTKLQGRVNRHVRL